MGKQESCELGCWQTLHLSVQIWRTFEKCLEIAHVIPFTQTATIIVCISFSDIQPDSERLVLSAALCLYRCVCERVTASETCSECLLRPLYRRTRPDTHVCSRELRGLMARIHHRRMPRVVRYRLMSELIDTEAVWSQFQYPPLTLTTVNT